MSDAILRIERLGAPPWPTDDPFLFCVHHDDAYPAGDDRLGPAASLEGRDLGQDFAGKDGWRMYHGDAVPGFPQHPHRGFETVTIVRRGYVDHSDSLGATARYGQGDVQWLTAGRGIVHCEMFPLLREDAPNPLELFQIWLNLPAANKFADPHFAMLWADTIPRVTARDGAGRATELRLIAGRLGDASPPPPPPASWASQPDAGVAIWTVHMEPGAEWALPAAAQGLSRSRYLFRGEGMSIAGRKIDCGHRVRVRSDSEIAIVNGSAPGEILILAGRPIGEPVAAYGPFVMNSPAEIQRAFQDYQRTRFGGWPWPSDEPVHPREAGRFAMRPGGAIERAR
ncbi:MAG: pirin family protein [Sandaracinaceae bacterium]|nr:pirin family protein [Sandaracinaceae bacterium]